MIANNFFLNLEKLFYNLTIFWCLALLSMTHTHMFITNSVLLHVRILQQYFCLSFLKTNIKTKIYLVTVFKLCTKEQ